jgi:hypothetical protein
MHLSFRHLEHHILVKPVSHYPWLAGHFFGSFLIRT